MHLQRRWRHLLLVMPLLAILASLTPALAQGKTASLSILQVDDSQYPLVTALVSVADANGIPIQGLTQDAFLVTEDGSTVEIQTVQEVTGASALNVVLALDISGSMKGAPIDATRQAAIQVLQNLPAQDKVGLLFFNERVQNMAALGGDRGSIISTLQRMQSNGDTALYDAIHEGVVMLQQAPNGRRAVVVFTDGEDTRSSLKLEDAVDTAQRFSVPIYVVGYGPKIKPKELQRIAELTGGAFFQAPKIQNIPNAFAQVMDALHRAYKIQYMGVTPADGREHELRVVLVQGPSSETSARFTARPGNLNVGIDYEGAPDRTAAEQVWQDLGKQPVDPNIPILGGTVTLRMTAQPGRIAHVAYQLDGNALDEVNASSYQWDTSAVTPGLHTLTAEVTDHVGNTQHFEQQAAIIPVVHVTLASPASGDAMVGNVPIALRVTTIDPISDLSVSFQGQNLGQFTGPPYEFTWTTSTIPPGDYVLDVAVTTQGGYQSSVQLPVVIGKHISVTLQSPQTGEYLEGWVYMKADVESDAQVSHVTFYVNDQEIGQVENPPYTLKIHTGDFLPGDYTLKAEAVNAAGMDDSNKVQVHMTPTTRTGALGLALILALAVLIIIPVIFVARKRRQQSQQPVPAVIPAPTSTNGAMMQGAASASDEQPLGWLTLVSGEADQKQYPIYKGETHIGRNREYADVRLSDMGVSRRHAIIVADAQGVYYQDLNSQNPSYINGSPVTQRTPLHNGDEIKIGNSKLLFQQTGG